MNKVDHVKESLEKLNKIVAGANRELAKKSPDFILIVELMALLSALSEKTEFKAVLQIESDFRNLFSKAVCYIYYKLFNHPKFKIDVRVATQLVCQKQFMHDSHVIAGQRPALIPYSQHKVKKALYADAASIYGDTIDALFKPDNPVKAIAQLSMMLHTDNLSHKEEYLRNFLKNNVPNFDKLPYNKTTAGMMSTLYMHSSYELNEDKHCIKKKINEWFNKNNKFVIKQNKKDTDKPVLIVPAERLTHTHVMFRWYGKLIESLKENYYTILVCPEQHCTGQSKQIFNEHIPFSGNVEEIKHLVNSVSPDVVYFPSVGMSAWVVALSNIRWADLQLASGGHPASTFSNVIDGYFVNHNVPFKQSVMPENQILLGNTLSSSWKFPDGIKTPVIDQNLDYSTIKIAIPSHSMKLNPWFIGALKAIQDKVDVPIQWHFFQNKNGLGYSALEKKIKETLPNSVVYYSTKYEKYLNNLAKCHFAISPYPFGNSSGVVDSIYCGLPVIASVGDEPHSKSDMAVLESFNLGKSWLTTKSDFVQDVINFCNPLVIASERDYLSKNIKKQKDVEIPFKKAIDWCYANKDKLNTKSGEVYVGFD